MYSIQDLLDWTKKNYPEIYPDVYKAVSHYREEKDIKRFPSLHAAAGATLIFFTKECPVSMVAKLKATATKRREGLWLYVIA